MKYPDMVSLDDVELWRIQRARVALLLHMPPTAVDEMPDEDIDDVLSIHNAIQELEAWHAKKRRR